MCQVSTTLDSRYELAGRLAIERLHLQPLPLDRFADYDPRWYGCAAQAPPEGRSVTYRGHSRLIGQQVTVHLHHNRLDLFLRSQSVETLPRLHARKGESGPLRRIDFRHVIDSLSRKPRALLRAQLQAGILPGENWRQLLCLLLEALPPDEAAKVMVDALHVGAKENDVSGVERYLRRQFRSGEMTIGALRVRYGLRPPRGLAALP